MRSLAVNSNGDIFARSDVDGGYVSKDNGNTWTKIDNGLDCEWVMTFFIDSKGYIYAGTWQNGVFRSIDNGESWTEFNNGLYHYGVLAFAENTKADLYLEAGGVYRTNLNCCNGIRGNVNGDISETINISDITHLVAYCFGGGPAPDCPDEANVNGDVAGAINISDITYLVAYCFGGGPEPPACP